MPTSLLKFSLKTNLVKSVISEIVSNISHYYYAYGHAGVWPNEPSPEAVSESYEYENEVRNEMLLYKQIDTNDIAAVITRINWVSGYTFDMFDEYSSEKPAFSGAASLENAEFYCLTDDYNVYKCLYNNNNNPSYQRPIGTSTEFMTMSDGYIWKYMYTIPLSVRNKFLSATTMPVVTALSNQFYSKGSIVAYNIENPGAKYPIAEYKIVGFRIVDGGSGYAGAPTVTIAPPDETGAGATISSVTISGGQVTAVTINAQGSGYSYSPTITVTGASARTAVLEPVLERIGTVGTTLEVTGDGYLEENPYEVSGITILDGGSGYSTAQFLFKSPDLSNGAIAVANGVIGDVQLTGTLAAATSATLTGVDTIFTTQLTTNSAVKINGTVYKVISVNSNTSITINTSITVASGAAIYKAGVVTSAVVTNPGYGYSKPFYSTSQDSNASNIVLPSTTTISGQIGSGLSFAVSTKKNEAQLTPLINGNGEIEGLKINKPGIGYTYATVKVITSDKTAVGFAEASILLSFGIGDIESQQSTVELTAINGAIPVINLTKAGYSYTSTPTVIVNGDGSDCTATAILNTNGTIGKILVNTPGINYTKATVAIIGGGVATGSENQALAHAIISPNGGHGKDAVSELYSKTLMLHGSLSKEKNNGFVSTNQYRQICIVKNPKVYGKNSNLRSSIASSCFTAIGGTAQASVNLLANDDILYYTNTTVVPNRVYSYRVIEKPVISSTNTASLLLSYLDNYIPPAGAVLTRTIGTPTAFSVASITYPDVNKYSGELLTIDNRTSFSPTSEQIVVAVNSITF